jgi:hypothetical protein
MRADLSDVDMPNIKLYPSTTNFYEHKRYPVIYHHDIDVSKSALRTCLHLILLKRKNPARVTYFFHIIRRELPLQVHLILDLCVTKNDALAHTIGFAGSQNQNGLQKANEGTIVEARKCHL